MVRYKRHIAVHGLAYYLSIIAVLYVGVKVTFG